MRRSIALLRSGNRQIGRVLGVFLGRFEKGADQGGLPNQREMAEGEGGGGDVAKEGLDVGAFQKSQNHSCLNSVWPGGLTG